jgi:hypothetical protein
MRNGTTSLRKQVKRWEMTLRVRARILKVAAIRQGVRVLIIPSSSTDNGSCHNPK